MAPVNSIIGPGPSPRVSVATLSPEQQASLLMLRNSLQTLPEAPEPSDRVSGPAYQPRNLYPHGPACFPSTPLSQTDSALLFERLPMDALFFVFYFQQGSPQQVLAARQLKKVLDLT